MSIAFGVRQPCEHTERSSATVPCSRHARRWVLVAAIAGSSLAFIEGSVVNLALPSLQQHFGLGAGAVQWVVNSYLFVLAAGILIGGAAGDRYGQRRVFVLGLAVFGPASLICALAPNIESLLVLRGLQGAGAALLIPASLALITVHYPADERAGAIGIWAGASALTTAIGPVLGGVLVDRWGWPSVFLAIAPLAAVTIFIAQRYIPRGDATATGKLDFVGALLLAASLFALCFALLDVREVMWAILLAIVGIALFALFVVWERRVQTPMIPLTLFRSAAFRGANVMTVALYFALTGALYFLPFNLIQIQGYSATQAGAAFLPLTLLIGVGSVALGKPLGRQSPRMVLTLGSAIAAVGFAAFALPGTDTHFFRDWLPAIVIVGVGMTLCVSPLTNVVMGAVASTDAGVASGINNTASRVAGALAMALLSGVATFVFAGELEPRLSGQLPAAEVDALLARADELAALKSSTNGRDIALVSDAVRASYVETFRLLMLICAGLAVCSAVIAWRTLPKIGTSQA